MADKKKEEKGLLDRGMDAASNLATEVVVKTKDLGTKAKNVATGENKKGIEDTLEELGVRNHDERIALVKRINSSENVSNLIEENNGYSGHQKERHDLAQIMVNTVRSNPDLIKKLDKDLAGEGNKSKRDAISGMLKDDPKRLSNLVSKYNGENLDLLLVAPVAAKVGEQGAKATQSEKLDKTIHATDKKDKKGAGESHSKDFSPVSVATELVSPRAAGDATVKKGAESKQTPTTQEMSEKDKSFYKELFESFAGDTDANISEGVNKKLVSALVDGLADDAVAKFGVDAVTAKAFKDAINDPKHPEIKEGIVKNLKNNPDFVRELAKASKDDKEIPLPFKAQAKTLMTDVMEQPAMLQDDAYVKGLTQKMQLKDQLGDSPFAKMFAGIGPWFSQLFAQISSWFKAFFVPGTVFMGSQGLMINTRKHAENEQLFLSENDHRTSQMKTLPIAGQDGKFRHTETYMEVDNKDGKAVEKSRDVPNTIAIKDYEGKSHKVIPSVPADGSASTSAKEQEFKAKDGSTVYRVTVVTDVNSDGVGKKLDHIFMKQSDFEEYKKTVEGAGGGSYPVSPYVSSRNQGQVVRLDEVTGREIRILLVIGHKIIISVLILVFSNKTRIIVI